MTSDPALLARRWAVGLPHVFARRLAGALLEGVSALRQLQGDAVLPQSAAAVRAALTIAEAGQAAYTAGLLTGRLDLTAEQPTITPVWTGPESTATSGRLTLAVIADLVDEARREVLLVNYATWPSASVKAALQTATDRDVAVTLLLERHVDNPTFTGLDDPFPGLHARRLTWPLSARPAGAAMHAKLLVIDRGVALVGSANLTGHGLERNLEAGVLIRGGAVPGQLVDHITALGDLRNIGD